MAGRDKSVEGFRRALDPMRLTLKTQAYLGGDAPNYADYIVFGAFQWARVVSPFKLLAEDDPVHAWREKLLDAFDGMARKSPGYHGVAPSNVYRTRVHRERCAARPGLIGSTMTSSAAHHAACHTVLM